MPAAHHETARSRAQPTLPPAPADGVLVTRPEPGGVETAARLRAAGWRPVLAPALTLHPVAPPPRLDGVAAVLLTSRAAARALAGAWRPGLPVFAVGAATAAAARDAGADPVSAAEGDAAALLVLARRRLDPAGGPVLLAVGAGYGVELAAELRAGGFRVRRRVVYAARPAAALPPPAQEALRTGSIGHALFLSPRSALHTMALLRAAGLADAARRIAALAISPRVAAALRGGLPWASIAVAARPDEAALLALLGQPDAAAAA